MLNIPGFLSPEERRELVSVLHSRGHTAREHVRVNAILLIDKGWSLTQVSEALFLDSDTVRGYFARYNSGKLEALFNDDYRIKQSKLTDEQKDLLRSHLVEHLYVHSNLITAYISLEFGVEYSPSGTNALLHQLGFVYKKPKHVPAGADLEAQEDFIRRFQELMDKKSSDTPVYFTDAMHPTHNSAPSCGWILRGEEKELPANCGRQRLNINGALNVETHEVITQSVHRVNAEATVELFKQIDAANPEADIIYVISDNAGCYHSNPVADYLASGQSRICLLFLPPYSPNLNLIERLWGFFRKKVMNNRYYPNFKKFSEEVLMFFECLSEYADELRTLLAQNFQRFAKTPGATVAMPY